MIPRHAFYETASLLTALEKHGVAHIPKVLSREQCDAARKAVDALQPIHWDETHEGPTASARSVISTAICVSSNLLPEAIRIPIYVITVHFYLNDITPQLAPTRVIPGSHRAGRAPRSDEATWRGSQPQAVIAHAGDCLVFRSDLWHAGSANSTERDIRYLLQVHYGRREMAQHFSPPMQWSFNRAVLDAATRRERRLLGDHEPGPYD